MKFEVKDRDGRTVMSTKHKSCVYPARIRNQMRAAGYKLLLNGKPFKKKEDFDKC